MRFCHWFIIHDDKTVISYFVPRHQTLKFSYNFKAKFDDQKSIGTQAFWGVYLWLNVEIEHDEKVTYLNTGILWVMKPKLP